MGGMNALYKSFVTDLYPEDDLEAAFVDAAADAVMDCHTFLRPIFMAKDEATKVRTMVVTHRVGGHLPFWDQAFAMVDQNCEFQLM